MSATSQPRSETYDGPYIPLDPPGPGNRRSGRKIVPTNMFELEAGKAVTQKYLDSGEITRDDIALLQKSYRMVGMVSVVASSLMGVSTYFVLRRIKPQWNLTRRLFAASGMGMLGSFLGFAVGGVGAAMEVQNTMPNAEQKMKVFGKIAAESRQAIIATRQGLPPPVSSARQSQSQPQSVGSSIDPDAFAADSVSNEERSMEIDRERSFGSTVDQIRSDSRMPSSASSSSPSPNSAYSSPSSSASSPTSPTARRGEINDGAKGAWDRIRLGGAGLGNAVGAGMNSGKEEGFGVSGGGVRGGEDKRNQEQRDFDEMLERERRGMDSGTDEGRWR